MKYFKDKASARIIAVAVIAFFICNVIIFLSLSYIHYTNNYLITEVLTTGDPDPTQPDSIMLTKNSMLNRVIMAPTEKAAENAITEFADEYFAALCGDVYDNQLVRDYMAKSALQPIPYVTPKESMKEDFYLLEEMGGEWDEEIYEKKLAAGEITLLEDDPDDSDPRVQVIDGKPYISIYDLDFNDDGVAVVRYMGHNYNITRSSTGFLPGQFEGQYTPKDFILDKIVPQPSGKTYDTYYKTYDGLFMIGLNVQLDKDNNVTDFKVIYS